MTLKNMNKKNSIMVSRPLALDVVAMGGCVGALAEHKTVAAEKLERSAPPFHYLFTPHPSPDQDQDRFSK